MEQSHTLISTYKISKIILGTLLVLLAPAANAITKHLSMVGENGQPLANTTITITFSDGTKEEEDTDEKGILMFDFKKHGVYTLSDPDGNVIKTIGIAGSGMSKTAMALTAAGAAALLLVAAGSSGDSGDSGSSDPAPADPVEPADPGAGDTGGDVPADGGGEESSVAGIYDVNTSVASNPGDHPVLLQQLVLQLQIIGTALTITQLSSNPNFPAQLSGSISGNSFSASANGVYSGFPALFQLAGTIVALQTLNFIITVGADGSLPGGQAITYDATGTKQ